MFSLLAPWVAALAILAVFGLLDPLHAVIAGLIAAVVTYVALRARGKRTDRLVGYLETLAENGDASPPASDSLAMDSVERAVGRLARAQARRTDKLKTRLGSIEALLEGLPDPLIVLDAGRRILRANAAARDLVGLEMTDRDLSVGLRDPDILDAVDEVLAGAPGRNVETIVTAPTKRQLSARIEPLAASATGAAAILLLHDVTEVKDMERMRADFVANASHELRTPITTLIGFVETLKGPARDDAENRDRFLDLMQEQAT
ncbi:MAG: histidine kinase dimerization/phospho-acceptor domain-containing protein, partial [Alphaproteobacteria bacterium]